MFNLVETGQVRVPLGDAANNPGVSNQMFLRDHVMNLLVNAFPNVSKEHVRTFVVGLFDLNKDINSFKLHLRDFLVQLKGFSEGDNSELYLEEKEKELAKAESEGPAGACHFRHGAPVRPKKGNHGRLRATKSQQQE